MTLLAPLWLWLGVASAGAVVALHFFARQRPRPAPFPTARFVPDVPARAPSPARKPTDLLLLMLRVLALLVAGLALSRPHVASDRHPLARVILVADTGAAASDSAREYTATGDTMIEATSLSSALVSGIRASSVLRERADSLELVIVSSFAAGVFDAATDSVRALWPGRARLVRLTALPPYRPTAIQVIGAADDPLRATVALLGARSGPVTRIVRATPSAADSAFAANGGVLVVWPSAGRITDTIGAVVAGGVTVVAPFARDSTLQLSDSLTLRLVIARWVDGLPAAIERVVGSGCIREVAMQVPVAGDLPLRRSFRELVDQLAGPCGSPRSAAPATEQQLTRLAGPAALMPSRLAPQPVREASLISAWLLAAAAALLLTEMAVRPKAPRG